LKYVVLVGHSLGSAIALQFAIDYPEKIAGIVCMGGGMKMPVNSFFLDFLKTNPAQLPEDVTGMISKFSLAKENRPKFFVPLQNSISQSRVDVLYGDLTACNDLDITQRTAQIGIPALIICGAEDKMTPPDLSRALAGEIQNATLEIVEGAGHMVMIEKPDEFNNSLDKFAASISAAVSG
jgi:pimeloyl-ACP methyl ester carboxylesterase